MMKASMSSGLLLILLLTVLPSAAKEIRATIVYDDTATDLAAVREDAGQLWITSADLKRATRFEVKPQGVCRDELCFPLPKAKHNTFIHKDRDKSAYVMSEDHLREKLSVQDPNIAQAAAEFGLGEQLYKSGHHAEAIAHFKEAQRLNPKSWNYKRQAYALTSEKDYGTTFRDEVQKIGGSKVYYPPPELPGEKKPN
jgi:tetratricopeptide (TPR) repeat protein